MFMMRYLCDDHLSVSCAAASQVRVESNRFESNWNLIAADQKKGKVKKQEKGTTTKTSINSQRMIIIFTFIHAMVIYLFSPSPLLPLTAGVNPDQT